MATNFASGVGPCSGIVEQFKPILRVTANPKFWHLSCECPWALARDYTVTCSLILMPRPHFITCSAKSVSCVYIVQLTTHSVLVCDSHLPKKNYLHLGTWLRSFISFTIDQYVTFRITFYSMHSTWLPWKHQCANVHLRVLYFTML